MPDFKDYVSPECLYGSICNLSNALEFLPCDEHGGEIHAGYKEKHLELVGLLLDIAIAEAKAVHNEKCMPKV